jgi:hypothetical protein
MESWRLVKTQEQHWADLRRDSTNRIESIDPDRPSSTAWNGSGSPVSTSSPQHARYKYVQLLVQAIVITQIRRPLLILDWALGNQEPSWMTIGTFTDERLTGQDRDKGTGQGQTSTGRRRETGDGRRRRESRDSRVTGGRGMAAWQWMEGSLIFT